MPKHGDDERTRERVSQNDRASLLLPSVHEKIQKRKLLDQTPGNQFVSLFIQTVNINFSLFNYSEMNQTRNNRLLVSFYNLDCLKKYNFFSLK